MTEPTKVEQCFFYPKSEATHDVEYNGYYTDSQSTSSYRGIIGLSVANFTLTEDVVFLPRGKFAMVVHILSALIKIFIFSAIVFYFTEIHLFWRFIFGFTAAVLTTQILHILISVKPRNLYLFNLSSLVDFGIFLLPIVVSELFFPDLMRWAFTLSVVSLFFVNNFTKKLKKYSLYRFPKELLSMYDVGFKHGSHPNIDNYLGFIIKPLRWLY